MFAKTKHATSESKDFKLFVDALKNSFHENIFFHEEFKLRRLETSAER